uniref:Uncharacterized protein n=1 Tax=Avena sativa TaxID=4498 RepID=A0ACD5WY72_AVESA
MSTIYMSQLSTAFPLMEEDHHHQDHHQGHFQAFTMPSKDPPILFPFVISSSSPSENSSLSYGGSDPHHLRQHAAMLEPQHMIGGSSSVLSMSPFPTVESIRDDMIERSSSSYDPYDMEKLQAAAASGSLKAGRWTAPAPAAKMRITRKTSDPAPAGAKKPRRRAQAYEDHHGGHMMSGMMNQALGVIRTCSDCNTTKTPLWRSGPCGPKSLCNACGIRQRKARRAMMASVAAPAAGTDVVGAKAAAAQGDAVAAAVTAHHKVKKEKRAVDVDRSLPFKKRCKVVQDHAATNTVVTGAAAAVEVPAEPVIVTTAAATAPERADLVDTIGANWSMSPAACFRPSSASAPFAAQAQDEITDAAMLLMTLSCELVRS